MKTVLTEEAIWSLLSPLVEGVGASLFDVEFPRGKEGVLRVLISSAKQAGIEGDLGSEKGVTLDNCAELSKRILDLENVEDLLPGECTLEVSTPGINRKLRNRRHFQGAIGERVRLIVEKDRKRGVVKGVLNSLEGETLCLREEVEGKTSKKERRTPSIAAAVPQAATRQDGDKGEKPGRFISLSDVKEARVDFIF